MVETGSSSLSESREGALREFWRVIVERRFTVLIFFACAVAAMALVTARMTRVYRATATVLIDSTPPQVLENVKDVAPLGTGYGYAWYTRDYYGTQYEVIASRAVAQIVVDKLGLHRDLKFLGLDNLSPDERAELPALLKKADPVAILLGMLEIEPIEETRIVRVHVNDVDPTRAARLADAIADAYAQYNLESRTVSTREAVDWLAGQTDELRGQVEKSEQELNSYKQENDLLFASLADQQSLASRTLAALNDALIMAKKKRMELDAAYKQAKSLLEGTDGVTSLSVIEQHPLIGDLKRIETEAARRHAQLQARYLEDHPTVQASARELAEIRSRLKEQTAALLNTTKAEYEAAVTNERSLLAALDAEKSKGMSINRKEIDYKRLEQQAENNRRLYGMVSQRHKELGLAGLLNFNNVRVLDRALVPGSPVKPKALLNMLAAALLGLVGGLGLAFLLDYLDNTIKHAEALEKVSGVPVIGVIPLLVPGTEDTGTYGVYGRSKRKSRAAKNPPPPTNGAGKSADLHILQHPRSAMAESLRSLRTNLQFMGAERGLRTMLVTSALPQEGKTLAAINIGIVMVQGGRRTILVDTDMRRPRLHKGLHVPNTEGISTAIIGQVPLDKLIRKTSLDGLDLLTCGPIPPNPVELLGTEAFSRILEELKRHYDCVILDSPPILSLSDGLVITRHVDGVVFVAKQGRSTRETVAHAFQQLRSVNARVAGTVLNAVDTRRRAYGYYNYRYYGGKYGYYYQDYYAADDDSDESSSKTPDVSQPPVAS